MGLLEILQLLGGVGLAGGVLWLLRRLGLLGGSSRAGQDLGQGLDRASREGRQREDRAREQREDADDAAIEKITNRPVTDDPAADLADRLYGDNDDGAA